MVWMAFQPKQARPLLKKLKFEKPYIVQRTSYIEKERSREVRGKGKDNRPKAKDGRRKNQDFLLYACEINH